MAGHDHDPRFVALTNDALTRVREISIAETRAKLDRGETFLLIDVREDGEWAESRLPGAAHLGKGIIERDIAQLAPGPDVEMVLYCGGGYRSALAADNLQKMGYTKVSSMAGGIRAWREAGFPLMSGG